MLEQLKNRPVIGKFITEAGNVNWSRLARAKDWELELALCDLEEIEIAAIRKMVEEFHPTATQRVMGLIQGVDSGRLKDRVLAILDN